MRITAAFPIFVFLIVLVIFPTDGRSQGHCVIQEIKVSMMKGKVLLPNKIVIPDAVVEIHEGTTEGRIVSWAKTDADCKFIFKEIPKGKYILTASYPNLVTLAVPVKVSPSTSRKANLKEIVVVLNGLLDTPCGGGAAFGIEQ